MTIANSVSNQALLTTSNTAFNNVFPGYTTTATAASSTALTISSTYFQYWTGSTTQTVTLPHTGTILGTSYYFVNNSTGAVTVESSGGGSVQVMAAGSSCLFTCISAGGTTAGSWNAQYFVDLDVSGAVLLAPSGSQAITLGSLTVSAGNIIAGNVSGGAAGFLLSYPGTTLSGTLILQALNSAGNFNGIINNASLTAARTWVLPDASGTVLLTGSAINSVPSIAFSSTSGIIGTTTNDNAAAGSVGEFVSAGVDFASPVSLTNNSVANVTSITLTAGDWDIWGNLGGTGNSSTIVNFVIGAIYTTNSAIGSANFYSIINYGPSSAVTPFNAYLNLSITPVRVSITTTTTYYLNALATFSVSTAGAFGNIYARRRR